VRLALALESCLDAIQDRLIGQSVRGKVKAAGEGAAEVVENGSAVMKKMGTRVCREPALGARMREEAIERGEGAGGR